MNDEWLSPLEISYGSRPRLPLLPFPQPAYHRVLRQRKTYPRARMCYFLNFGYNHGRDCYRLLDAETGRVAYSRDVTWQHRGSPRSGPRQPNRRATSPFPCRSLCPSPRHLLYPSPLRQLPHRQRHYRHRLHQRRTPRLRSPRASAANYNTRDTWRCPGGRVARPVYCTMRHGITPIVMVYHWAMRLYGVNAGERRSNQRDCLPTWRLQGLAGSADRACVGSIYTQQCVRRGEIAPCRHMATLHAPGIHGLLQAGTFAPVPA